MHLTLVLLHSIRNNGSKSWQVTLLNIEELGKVLLYSNGDVTIGKKHFAFQLHCCEFVGLHERGMLVNTIVAEKDQGRTLKAYELVKSVIVNFK